jgi:hypothetical protein
MEYTVKTGSVQEVTSDKIDAPTIAKAVRNGLKVQTRNIVKNWENGDVTKAVEVLIDGVVVAELDSWKDGSAYMWHGSILEVIMPGATPSQRRVGGVGYRTKFSLVTSVVTVYLRLAA